MTPKRYVEHMSEPSAKLYTWYGQTLYLGHLPNIEEHCHHALQIEIGMQNPFKIFCGQDVLECRLAVIPSDVPHRIDDCNSYQAIIYLDPEYKISKLIKEKYIANGNVKKLSMHIIHPFLTRIHKIREIACPCSEARILLDDILTSLAGDYTLNEILDRRIKKVIDICRQTPNKIIPTRVLADEVDLSEGRLTHLFKQQVGIPIRRYLLWLRLSDALMALSKGGSFTDAAHYAGFSDSAHLSRTYRKMYGNSLYNLARDSQFIQAIPCFE